MDCDRKGAPGKTELETPASKAMLRVAYVRVPGLLSRAAREARNVPAGVPVAVSENRSLRDACIEAIQSFGVSTGMSVVQARRLCPALFVIPFEEVDARKLSRRLLDVLADVSPIVEPLGSETICDAAYADVSGWRCGEPAGELHTRLAAVLGLVPVVGIGASRVAACACGECNLLLSQLSEASTRYLWPEEAEITSRLHRLGLSTFGQVAAVGESALVYQFGRKGRLLYRRAAYGKDDMPLRPLYPPLRADTAVDLSGYPEADASRLHARLQKLAETAASELKTFGRYGRRVVLRIRTENAEEQRREAVMPLPVQMPADLYKAALRLLTQMTIASPVISLRLLVEEMEVPTVQTADLFGGGARDRKLALMALHRRLSARYGQDALRRLSELPCSLRDQRLASLREAA